MVYRWNESGGQAVKGIFSESRTHGICVRARARFHPERSFPNESEWHFSYTVDIENQSSKGLQVIAKHWVITDAMGQTMHLRGNRMLSTQPILQPGEAYSYEGSTPLSTSIGTMRGTIELISETGEKFDADIPLFTLVDPNTLN